LPLADTDGVTNMKVLTISGFGFVPGTWGRWVLGIILTFLMACSWGKTYVNPQIAQGSSSAIAQTGALAPTSGTWQVIDAGAQVVGSSSASKGWNISYNTSTSQITVTVPSTALVGVNYTAVINAGVPLGPHSASFDVISGAYAYPPDPPTNLVATGLNASVTLTWDPAPYADSYIVTRAYISNGVKTTVATNVTLATYTDSGLTNNLPYYYTVSAVNSNGTGGFSSEVAGTPQDGSQHFEIAGIQDYGATVQLSVKVVNAMPTTSTTTSIEGGITYYKEKNIVYFLCTNSTSYPVIIPTGSTLFSSSATDPWNTPASGETVSGLQISSYIQTVKVQMGSSHQTPARVYLVSYTTGRKYHYVGTTQVQDGPNDTPATAILAREDYKLYRYDAKATSVGSRKTYGQPNVQGKLPADPNADLRNPSYYGWTYEGGLFVGNASPTSGDLSATTRIQTYITMTIHTNVDPVWTTFSLMFLGCPTGFDSVQTLTFYKPATDDPNYDVTSNAVTWATAWDLTRAVPRSEFTFNGSISPGDYACFQNPGIARRMALALKNEASLISGTNAWYYFMSVAYAAGMGYSDPDMYQPHAFILDRVLKRP